MYAPEDKDLPEGKELPNLFGLYIEGYTIVIKRWRNQGAETSETFFYQKLLYEANSSKEMWNLQVLNPREHIVIPQ